MLLAKSASMPIVLAVMLVIGLINPVHAVTSDKIRGFLGFALHTELGELGKISQPEESQWSWMDGEWYDYHYIVDFPADDLTLTPDVIISTCDGVIEAIDATFYYDSADRDEIMQVTSHLRSLLKTVYYGCETLGEYVEDEYGSLVMYDEDGNIVQLSWDCEYGDLWLTYYSYNMPDIAVWSWIESREMSE